MARRIVQISSASWNAGFFGQKRSMTVFALADDGNVYSLTYDSVGAVESGWVALPTLPARLSDG